MTTKAKHTLIIASALERTPAIVKEARRHGLKVSHQDRALHYGEALHIERQWTVFCTEADFERFIEWGQP